MGDEHIESQLDNALTNDFPVPSLANDLPPRVDDGADEVSVSSVRRDIFTPPVEKFVSDTELRHRFTYHPPTQDKVMVHSRLRERAYEFAKFINDTVPEGPDKTLALRKIEESVFWANAAVARH